MEIDLPDLSEMQKGPWQTALRDFVSAHGEYLELDAAHHVMQVGTGDKLIVTFESASDIRNSRDMSLPYGLNLAQEIGNCAVITVMCTRPTWFRSDAVYEFFDHLTDGGVFEDFEHVVFFGTGLGGYGAAAFSIAAPGSDVVVISPQATLDPRMTEWDPRFASQRINSFTDRYGFAPEMAEGARHTLVLYNPDEDVEAMHSALFARPGVTRFRCRHLGHNVEDALEDMGLVPKMIQLALDKKLSLLEFAKIYRARRDYGPYMRSLLTEIEDQDRPQLVAWMASSVLERKTMPRMRRAFERANRQLRSARAAE